MREEQSIPSEQGRDGIKDEWDTHSLPRRIVRTCRTGWRVGVGHLREPLNPLHHACRKFAFSALDQHRRPLFQR
jgi:hypothetical protein